MIDDRLSDGGFFLGGGEGRNFVQRLVNITGGGENFMYAHVVEHHPPGRVHPDPSPRFSLSSGPDGHKKPLTDIIHSKLVYNVPTCSVGSPGGRSRPKRKSATGHVAT